MPLVADDRVLRTGVVAVVGAVACSVLLATLGDPWRTASAGVLAVLLVALGSPHGALDHLVLARSGETGRPAGVVATWRGMSARFVVPYAGLAFLSLAAYLLAPRAGFALFLVLSVAHFAAGEAGVAVERGLAHGWTDPRAWVAALGGAVVVVVPLASREAGGALAAVDPRLAPVLAPLPLLADAVVVACVVAVLGCLVGALRGDPHSRTVALELATLTALAALAHPLLAFAAYFAFWHSLRHQARLAQVLRGGPAAPPPPGYQGRPLAEVLRSAVPGVPATVGVLLGSVALALTGATLLGGLLAVIWALTVPHSVAVAVLETRAAAHRRATRQATVTDVGTGRDLPASKGHDTFPAPAGSRAAAHPDRVRG